MENILKRKYHFRLLETYTKKRFRALQQKIVNKSIEFINHENGVHTNTIDGNYLLLNKNPKISLKKCLCRYVFDKVYDKRK